MNARRVALLLGGQVAGRNHVRAPAPGCAATDRSLTVALSYGAPDGFLIIAPGQANRDRCRRYVLERIKESAEPGFDFSVGQH